MSRLNEYNPEFGVVFDTEEDEALKAFYAANPGLRPGAAGGGSVGRMFANPAAAPATAPAPPRAPAPTAPAGPPPVPEGWKPGPTPGSILRLDGFASATLNPQTNQYEPDRYPPSATTLAAAGITKGGGAGGGSTTPRVNYAEQRRPSDQTKEDLIARGGRALGENTIIMPNQDKYTLGNNGYFGPFGRASQTDIAAVGRDIAAARAAGASFQPGMLTQQQTANTVVPNAPGTRTTQLPGSVNNVRINDVGLGFNGFINPSPPQRAPASMGFGPGVSTNMQVFRPTGAAFGSGFTQADNQIRGSYTVPEWMDFYTGRNDAGVAVPSTIGVTMGGPQTFDQMLANGPNTTVPIQLAGNNVTFSAPDKSWGTGFVLDAMPHSNIALAQGRDFSGLSPQAQAAATFMLLDEQMNGGMSDAYAGGADWNAGIDMSTAGFAEGGRVQLRSPLGRPDLVTNEPIVGVGVHSRRPRFILGEDNADADRRPNREAVYFSRGGMDIVPLEPPAFAQGGRVQQQSDDDPNYWRRFLQTDRGKTFIVPQIWPAITGPMVAPIFNPLLMNDAKRFDEGGTIRTEGPTGDVPGTDPTAPPPPPPPPKPLPDGTEIPIDPGGIVLPPPPPVIPPFTDPYKDYNPLDNAILAPWQQAQNQLGREQAVRQATQYRRQAGGLGAELGIAVLEGQEPTTAAPAGTFWDYRPQVNRVIGDLLGAQGEYRALGPEEDVSADLYRVSQIGSLLDDLKRIGDLELQTNVIFAGVPTQGEIDALNAQYLAMEAERGRLVSVGQAESPQMETLLQQMAALRRNIGDLEGQLGSATQKKAAYDAQILALRGRIGAANEADLRTELARRQEKINNQDKRVQRKVEVANLAKLGVPNLSGGRTPVAA